jgi:dipeptidyl aminopeptidase/acylaminoacyl peptidase
MASMKQLRLFPITRFRHHLLWSFAALMVLSPVRASWAETITLRRGLAVGGGAHAGRSPVHSDAIEAEIISGKWQRPVEGDRVQLVDGTSQQWHPIEADTNGWFANESWRGGYALMPMAVVTNCVMLLEAAGDDLVYVNGELRAGDPYEYGYLHLPVALHAGTNDLLFRCSRGRFKAAFTTPTAPAALDLADQTLPDLIAGEKADAWGAVVVVNATAEPMKGLILHAAIAGQPASDTPVPIIPPLSARKVGFKLRGKAPGFGDTAPVALTLLASRGQVLHSATAKLRIRRSDQTQKRTFLSEIDGSVQYWALNPAQPIGRTSPPPALFLSVHGASVEAIGQADAYSPKSWGHLVAPTNRRPYGFDWESWGRMDAMEVLELARNQLHPDPQRIYLTGHSMGGHGAWQLGALFPDHFAAVGPSAGWISFFSYADGRRFTNATPVEALLERATAPCDTLTLETNYLQEGVYILHGTDDDNVPVTQARTMAERLGRFHRDFQYHEQPGASHWWDASDEPGADCVDWAPMFDFFAHHVIPTDQSLRQICFTTVNPGVSASCHWLEIEQQIHALKQSVVDVRWDPGKRRFVGTTENVARLAFSLNHVKPGQPLKVELDGQTLDNIPWPNAPKLWLQNEGGHWRLTSKLSPALKGPLRYGPFKDAFRHHMIFVYGTKGTPEENAWALNKARFDAESFWYRGNGSVDVIPDAAFNPLTAPDRGVILYGNSDSNGAWPALLADSPVQVRRGEIRLGSRSSTGDDLACLFLRPRLGSAVACVAVVSGSGVTGMRLTDRLPYFLSGVEYPDVTVIGSEMLKQGSKGVRAAGFFGVDWSVQGGEFAWRAD